MTSPTLNALEAKLGHDFRNRALLEQAVTHSSYARENQGLGPDNEQLEFAGDAVLGIASSGDAGTATGCAFLSRCSRNAARL